MSRTFGDVLEESIHAAKARGCEPATVKNYVYMTKRFLVPALGEKKVHKLKPRHLDALYRDMKTAGLNPTTIRKCNVTAGIALKLAERNEWITSNPARLAELPKTEGVKRDIPTPEELASFLECAIRLDTTIHHYGRVMAASGVRPGEACGLMRSDLDNSGCLHVQRAVDVCEGSARIKSTKTGKTRKVILDDATASTIRNLQEPYCFGGKTPARTDLMSKRWRRVARKAGVSFTPRYCRHFHATQLLGSGMSPRAVADRLGHSTPNITLAVYAQSIPAHDQVAADTIAAVLGGKS